MPGLLSCGGIFGRINQLVLVESPACKSWPCNDPATAGLSPRKLKTLPKSAPDKGYRERTIVICFKFNAASKLRRGLKVCDCDSNYVAYGDFAIGLILTDLAHSCQRYSTLATALSDGNASLRARTPSRRSS